MRRTGACVMSATDAKRNMESRKKGGKGERKGEKREGDGERGSECSFDQFRRLLHPRENISFLSFHDKKENLPYFQFNIFRGEKSSIGKKVIFSFHSFS